MEAIIEVQAKKLGIDLKALEEFCIKNKCARYYARVLKVLKNAQDNNKARSEQRTKPL
jgi:hypothetical protein